jgi:hypothetical protein
MGCILHRRRVPYLASLVLVELRYSLVDLWEVCCFLRILVALLRFACLLLLLVTLRMWCNLSLRALIPLPVDERSVYVARSIEHVHWGRVVLSGFSYGELLIVLFSIASIS